MFFTEAWITEEHGDSEISLIGFQSPTISRKSRGGTCIFVKESISFYEVNPPNQCEDSSWIVIQSKNSVKRLYACVYRSPNSTNENNQKLIDNIVWAKYNYNEIILVGDFNYPEINWDTESSASRSQGFIDIIQDLGLYQLISEPTRYRNGQEPSLLDLIMTSDDNLIRDIDLKAPLGKSDHVVIEFSVKNQHVTKERKLNRLDLKRMDIDVFRSRMDNVNWNDIFDSDNLDSIYQEMVNIVNAIVYEITPICSKFDKNRAPWSTLKIKKLSRKKRKLWDKYRFKKNNNDYEAYQNCLIEFNHEKEEAIRRYEKNVISNKDTNPKRYYRCVSSKEKLRIIRFR